MEVDDALAAPPSDADLFLTTPAPFHVGKRPRKSTDVACRCCVKAKAKCGTERPCPRCVRHGLTCVDRECPARTRTGTRPSQLPRTSSACMSCRRAKSRCDDGSPCQRCKRLRRSHVCRAEFEDIMQPSTSAPSEVTAQIGLLELANGSADAIPVV
ncbi:Zn(2)-C6 fungal-type domain-containing protein [Plasmodiophora brassicae]|uniref:Zn(2)-C6 fungal-type domain-containing protein n=1 Tax=Plasmodiophora brassicae TaxID=37360 RepID=A0A0G4IR67_PLABS|nr:hypothetical protein PBRA_005874 [Plasmodiophora brassicae]